MIRRFPWSPRQPWVPLALLLAGCEPLVYRVQPDVPAGEETPAPALLAKVVAAGPAAPVQGRFNGEQVVVDYSPGEAGACATLLVTYQNLSYSETWEACPDGKLRRADAPARNDEFRSVRHAVAQGAWKLGEAQAVYADYEIYAEAVGKPDADHCQTVELTVVQHGKTLETSHERVCGER